MMKGWLIVLIGALLLMGIVGCSWVTEYEPRETDLCYPTELVEPGIEEMDPECSVGKFMITLKLHYRLGFAWHEDEDFPLPSGVELEEAINSGRYNVNSVVTFYDPNSGLLRGAAIYHNYCRGIGNSIRAKILLPTTLEDKGGAALRMGGELHDIMKDPSIEIIKVVKAVIGDRLVGVEVYYRDKL
ncbi:MAG: hypothetical protein PHS27_01950 [Candidatus Pacebacteria bacterium]|nr:hypothetical protein [Candidatus Paceibacterota bacterium]